MFYNLRPVLGLNLQLFPYVVSGSSAFCGCFPTVVNPFTFYIPINAHQGYVSKIA